MARRGRLELALGRSLRAATITPEHQAATELARQYARALDEQPDDAKPAALVKLGPRLLDALVELGLTPKTRAAMLKGVARPPAASQLDELRSRRERRAGGT